MDLICALWHAKKRGQKTLSLEGWAGEIGKPSGEVEIYLIEIDGNGVCEINRENLSQITIKCRRMLRDERVRRLAAARQQKQRDSVESRTQSRDRHADVTGIYQKSDIRSQKSEEELREETTLSGSDKPDDMPPPRNLRSEAKEVLEFLNAKTGRHYRPVEATIAMIACRLKGENKETEVSVQTCKSLIAKKVRDWGTNADMQMYLRPATLFNRTKFEQYLGELNLCAVQNATKNSSATAPPVPVAGVLLRSL